MVADPFERHASARPGCGTAGHIADKVSQFFKALELLVLQFSILVCVALLGIALPCTCIDVIWLLTVGNAILGGFLAP
jgi:hypothetical protein